MKEKNLIFLTNDDGYSSLGFKKLINIINKSSRNFFIVAPEKNQSGKSHSISINKFVKVRQINQKTLIVNGSPVDCVILGLSELSLKKIKPRLLISGINLGCNMGKDLHYSGTVAAAREGIINGITSLAVSIQKNKKPLNWEGPNFFIPKIVKTLVTSKICKNNFININFPNLSLKKILGLKITRLGNRKPGLVIKREEINNLLHMKIPSQRSQLNSAKPGEDEYELNKGYVTLSFHDEINNTLNLKNKNKYESIKRKFLE